MPALDKVQAPSTIIHTDLAGKNAAGVNTTPPTNGVDYGLQVHANLGSGVIPVSQTLTGAANTAFGQISVANTATSIVGARATRRGVLITNPSTSVTVYIGPSNVTTTTGQALLAGNSLSIPTVGTVYGIVASGTQTITFVEAYD